MDYQLLLRLFSHVSKISATGVQGVKEINRRDTVSCSLFLQRNCGRNYNNFIQVLSAIEYTIRDDHMLTMQIM